MQERRRQKRTKPEHQPNKYSNILYKLLLNCVTIMSGNGDKTDKPKEEEMLTSEDVSATGGSDESKVTEKGELTLHDVMAFIQKTSQGVSNRLENVNESLTNNIQGVSSRLENVNDSLSSNIQGVSSKLEQHDQHFKNIAIEFQQTNQRIKEVEQKLSKNIKVVTQDINNINSRLDHFQTVVNTHETQLKTVETQIAEQKTSTISKMGILENRLVELEEECELQSTKQDSEIVEIKSAHEKLDNKFQEFQVESKNKLTIVEHKVNKLENNKLEVEVNSLKNNVVQIQESLAAQPAMSAMPMNIMGGIGLPVRSFPAEGLHPYDFIQGCKDSFHIAMNDNMKIKYVKRFLSGEALTWANEHSSSWTSFEEFEKGFIAKFWSESEQARIKSDFLNGPSYRGSSGSMVKFCKEQLKTLAHIRGSFDIMVQIDALKRRLPDHLQRELVNAPDKSIEEFLNYLNVFERVLEKEEKGHNNYGNDQYRSRRYNDNRGRQESYQNRRNNRNHWQGNNNRNWQSNDDSWQKNDDAEWYRDKEGRWHRYENKERKGEGGNQNNYLTNQNRDNKQQGRYSGPENERSPH